jgi:hypothetical protein
MIHLSGNQLPIEEEAASIQARAKWMLLARSAMVRATGRDYEYDVSKWHKYLTSLEAPERIRNEYTWSDKHRRFEGWKPDSNWQLITEEAQRLVLEFPNCPKCGSFASMRKVSHDSFGIDETVWLCVVCKKQAVISW